MPPSAKMRKYAKKARPSRASVNSRVQRAVANMTGGYRRGMIPAMLRAGRNTTPTEIKSTDCQLYTATPIQFKTAGVIKDLLAMPGEGPGFYDRIGRRTRGLSLEVRGMIQPTLLNAAEVKQQFARVIIYYDRQTNGALPSIAAVLTDYDTGGAVTSGSVFNGVNMDNRDRFMIIRDRKFVLPAIGALGVTSANTATGLTHNSADLKESLVNYCEYIKLNGLETQYKNTSGGLASDISTGSFGIIVISSGDANATAAYSIAFNTRYKFLD